MSDSNSNTQILITQIQSLKKKKKAITYLSFPFHYRCSPLLHPIFGLLSISLRRVLCCRRRPSPVAKSVLHEVHQLSHGGCHCSCLHHQIKPGKEASSHHREQEGSHRPPLVSREERKPPRTRREATTENEKGRHPSIAANPFPTLNLSVAEKREREGSHPLPSRIPSLRQIPLPPRSPHQSSVIGCEILTRG